jgi:microcystin degradation protein MlrC
MRIAVGCIGHETNTFSLVPTTIESFKKHEYYVGEEMFPIFKNTGTIMGGYMDAAEKWDMELAPLLWTFANPSGIVEQSAYETLKSEFLELLHNAGNLDGVLLDLHGAMAVEKIEDGEADLIAAVRDFVGALPIVTTLDLHANIGPQMAEFSDVIIGYDTYPHVDMYDRGYEAAQLLHKIVEGKVVPTMAYRQLPLLTSPPGQCTMKQPMIAVLEKLHALEEQPGVETATLSMGFPFADIAIAGVTVLVTTNNDQALADRLADEFSSYVWEMREKFQGNLVSIEEAIAHANKSEGKPIVLAEGSDNPGGGAPCDGTHILRAFIEADVQDAVFAIIADPESVDLAIKAGIGKTVSLQVGGKTDPRHGEPVALDGNVKLISDGFFVHKGPMSRGIKSSMGRSVVIVTGGIEIILTENRTQPFDAEVLRSVDIEPTDRKIIVLKSAVHFRADYTPIAHEILDVDTPGVHSPNLSTYDYKNVRRPIYPLDENLTLHDFPSL